MATSNITPPAVGARERSIGELFGELASETGTLVRQEVQLAKTELTQKATFIGKQAAIIAIGAMVGVVALITMAGALVLVLGEVMPLWAAALIVTAVLAVSAYVVVNKGLGALKRNNIAPTETLASMKDTKTWATRQLQ